MGADSDIQLSVPREEEVETLAAGGVDWMIGATCSSNGGLTSASTAIGDDALQV